MAEYQYEPGKFVVSSNMKRDFDEDGFVIVRNLLNTRELEKIKSAVVDNGLMKEHAYKILDTDGRGPLMALWKHPGNDATGMLGRCKKVVTTSEKLLGVDELYHYHCKILLKEPEIGGKFEWHQDYGYWYNYCLRPDMMAVFVAVDECTQENGGLLLLKGSHKCGRIEHGFAGGQQGANLDRVNFIKTRCDLVATNLQPGDAVFFHSNVLHCSGPNKSQKRRMAINISFNEASNQPSEQDICPPYTKLHKVPDTAIEECTNVSDFTGKIFVKPEDDKLVKTK